MYVFCLYNYIFFIHQLNNTRIADAVEAQRAVQPPLLHATEPLALSETRGQFFGVGTLPETNIFAAETGWLGYELPLGFRPIFRGFHC